MEILASFEPLILTIHFIVCIFLLIVILLQAGKGADMGATFGAGSSQTLFGARGAATLLSKLTTVAALVFLMTSMSLTGIHRDKVSSGSSNSVVQPSDEDITPEKVDDVKPDETTTPSEDN